MMLAYILHVDPALHRPWHRPSRAHVPPSSACSIHRYRAVPAPAQLSGHGITVLRGLTRWMDREGWAGL